MGTKSEPGSFDCYANAEPDEPMFVLLARDPDAPRLVESWMLNRYNVKPHDPENDRMIAEAGACVEAMERWYAENRVLGDPEATP